MKNLSFTDKTIFLINSIAAFLLLASYVIPFIPPKVTATISVLSLGMPVLLLINTMFLIFWVLKLKKQFLLSLLILGIGFQHVNAFIQFGKNQELKSDLKIMSYNVRLFNAYKWSKKNDIDKNIYGFIRIKSPDILCFQEYFPKDDNNLNYPYQYIVHSKGSPSRQAIYSKYKIIDSGSLGFDTSGNNAIYTDIKLEKDTLRIYNIHLQSFSIDKNKDNFGEKDSETLLKKFKSTFSKQEKQVNKIVEHSSHCRYKTIFMGDFNNTSFSWVYKKLKQNKNDAFIEAGKGFGKSFDYLFPFRIDFILTDSTIKVDGFETYNVKYSDHFPIMAHINLSK
jgi:endonuclease/exonuclease/phosphatase family metal-dependent hydrolase